MSAAASASAARAFTVDGERSGLADIPNRPKGAAEHLEAGGLNGADVLSFSSHEGDGAEDPATSAAPGQNAARRGRGGGGAAA